MTSTNKLDDGETRCGLQVIFYPSPVPDFAEPEVNINLDKAMQLIATVQQKMLREIMGKAEHIRGAANEAIDEYKLQTGVEKLAPVGYYRIGIDQFTALLQEYIKEGK